jgi:hypothetical protein
MYNSFVRSTTSNILRAKLRSSTAPYNGRIGLTFASTGLQINTIANNEATSTLYSSAAGTIETVTTLGTFAAPTATKCRFKEVDSTSHPGLYEFQFADARFAIANSKSLFITIKGATSMNESDIVVTLADVNPFDPLSFGMTAVKTSSNIKKNQALAKFQFLMTDSTNHLPATGKTVTVTRSIDGAAFGAGTLSAVTELSNGLYGVDFATGDLNGNVIMLRAAATGCDDTFERIITVPT